MLELLASRVCHDLISPIGAVGNGLELIEEGGGDTAGDALQLSVNCVKRASALLEFFRMAYGAAGSDASLRWDAARGLAAGLLNGSKIALVWPPMPTGLELPPGAAKLLLNLVLLATDTLPRGGEIAIGVDPAGNRLTLSVTASGRDARVTEEMGAALKADS
ncbi:MAG: histidine phosphotransferase family protein, partial [Dongiaceae bacterium]